MKGSLGGFCFGICAQWTSTLLSQQCHRSPFQNSGKFKKLLLHEASPHIPQELTELSNLVFLDSILVAKGANLILSREGYRVDRH